MSITNAVATAAPSRPRSRSRVWRKLGRKGGQVLRLGAIDTAASVLVPRLLDRKSVV